jgi:hypothetical protein
MKANQIQSTTITSTIQELLAQRARVIRMHNNFTNRNLLAHFTPDPIADVQATLIRIKVEIDDAIGDLVSAAEAFEITLDPALVAEYTPETEDADVIAGSLVE